MYAAREKFNIKSDDHINHSSTTKMFPAVHFPATLLKIGAFKEVDLAARCYYGRKKLMWEIFDRDKLVKYKIEIEWHNILAMRAILEENKPGILEIELDKPPTFYRETNQQRGSRTSWTPSKDFTEGQALIHRRHYVEFPVGVLDIKYERLLQSDERLKRLSQLHFPSSLVSPYFGLDPLFQGSLHGTSQTNAIKNHPPPFFISPQQAVQQQFGPLSYEGGELGRLQTNSIGDQPPFFILPQKVVPHKQSRRTMPLAPLIDSTLPSLGPLSYQGFAGLLGTLQINSISNYQPSFFISPPQAVLNQQCDIIMPLPPLIDSSSLSLGNTTQPSNYGLDNGDFGVNTSVTDSGVENENSLYSEFIKTLELDFEENAKETKVKQSCGLDDEINFNDIPNKVDEDFEIHLKTEGKQFGKTMPLPPLIDLTSLNLGVTDSDSGMENENSLHREFIKTLKLDFEENVEEMEGMQSCGLDDEINFNDIPKKVYEDFEMHLKTEGMQFGRTMPLPPLIDSTSQNFGVTDSNSGIENENSLYREFIKTLRLFFEENAEKTEGMQSCGLDDEINFNDIPNKVDEDFEMHLKIEGMQFGKTMPLPPLIDSTSPNLGVTDCNFGMVNVNSLLAKFIKTFDYDYEEDAEKMEGVQFCGLDDEIDFNKS